MSFNVADEARENIESFRDQLECLQSDLVMARTYLRKDLESAKEMLQRMKRRIDYTLENY